MKFMLCCAMLLVWPISVHAQADPDDPPPTVSASAVMYGPYPPGMRLQVGAQGVLARNTASATGTCGADNHMCTQADLILANTYGVVQPDAPVLDPAGWYWSRISYENGATGWSTAYPPILNSMTPPQMIAGSSFNIVGDYNGPVLTNGKCISDGVPTDAIMVMQPSSAGQSGTLRCPWNKPAIGNHKQVMQAINANGTASSAEFQFAVTQAPIPPVPFAPGNLRITPVGSTTVQMSPTPEK